MSSPNNFSGASPMCKGFLALAAALSVVASVTQGGGVKSRPQYEGITDPLVGAYQQAVIAGAPPAGPAFVIATEAARLNALAIFGILDLQVDTSVAKAMAVYYTLDLLIAVEAVNAVGEFHLGKLKRDIDWYEKTYPKFPFGFYNKADKREVRAYENYRAMRRGLERYVYEVDVNGKAQEKNLFNAEKTLKAKYQASRDTVIDIGKRAQKAAFSLGSWKSGATAIAQSMNELHDVLFDIQHMVDDLSRDGPHREVLATFSNLSPNLMFFVQVMTPGADKGSYTVRKDTQYPIPLYPNLTDPNTGKQIPEAELKKLQNEPYGPRGSVQVRLAATPGDKIVVRAITMGQYRDRIRFMKLSGKSLRFDDNSIKRGYYYVGYEIETPSGMLVSRLYPEQEKFTWTFSKSWAEERGKGSLRLVSSGGKDLAGKSLRRDIALPNMRPLALEQDQLEWTVPATLDEIRRLEDTSAEVRGSARFRKVGPAAKKEEFPEESGEGQLKVYLELW